MPSSLRETVQPGISKRTEFPLIHSKACLLIIDVQSYLSHTEDDPGSFAYKSIQTMIENIPRLTQAFRTFRDTSTSQGGCEVIFTYLQSLTQDGRDISLDYKLSGPTLAHIPKYNTPLQDLFLETVQPELQQGKGDILIPKTSCSVFMSTNLDYVLRNLHVEQIVICGQLTDQCVESAVRDAADLGYFVTVIKDACAAQSADAEAKGFKGMSGFCRMLSTADIIQELKQPQTQPQTQQEQQSLPRSPEMEAAKRVGAIGTDNKGVPKASHAPISAQANFTSEQETAYTSALLHSLKAAGIEFLRYFSVDVCNTVRCKAVPVDHLVQKQSLNYQVSIAKVCMAGLPSFADSVMEGTGLDARDVLIMQPDLSTLRVPLPYAKKSALMLGTLHDPKLGGTLSELCTRGLLQRVTNMAKEDFGITVQSGAEIEFCLFDLKSGTPVDHSIFASSTTLNQQEDFIGDLYNQLREQRIPIELVHAESACGQLELVIEYQDDPVRLADFVLLTQESIRAVATSHSLKAIFLPKMDATQAGNGLHVHLSFNDAITGENAFTSIGSLSDRGESFLEGILQHLPGLLALTMPTANSFRRVGPGCWTGSGATWALEDKEAALRVCSSLHTQEWQHVEYKLNDSTGNLYLSLAAILACGLDGIKRSAVLRPAKPESNTALPQSLTESLVCLENDELLTQVLGPTLSKAYIALRRAEAKRSENMTLKDEFQEAIKRA